MPRRTKQAHHKPTPPPPRPKPNIAELVEKHRERVYELDARGYLPNGIAAVLHLPYAVIEEILSTKAKPRKPQ